MSEPLSVRKLIERLSSGDIRIPAFQRDYIWDSDQVAFLLDSIYKKFPIGTIILWRTDNRLSSEKDLGQFTLPEPRKDYPVNYVLDGQQRITSLFSVFQTDLTPNSEEWTDIYFDIEAKENIQESVFIPLEASEVDHERHFPAKVLFDTVGYRRATEKFSDEKVQVLDKLQECFKEYLIPNEIFESDDRNSVAIVFERINRAGTELNIFQLLSAWSWSEDFDLTDKFQDLQEDIVEHGYEDFCSNTDLQLRICAGVIKGETTPAKILEMQGDEIRSSFDKIRSGIIGAIDFLRRELKVQSYKLLPFPGVLVPLSVFFATDKSEGISYTDLQKEKLLTWFWRSVFSRRYSAGVNEKQAFDINEMLFLEKDENYQFKYPPQELKFDFSKSNFAVGNANSKTLILMLSSMSPYSFLSGATIDLDKILQKINKNEFHHIFPKKHLERSGRTRNEINVLTNICFLTRGDNNQIKDKNPKDYSEQISKDKFSDYMERAIIPEDFGSLDYDSFTEKRKQILNKKAYELMA